MTCSQTPSFTNTAKALKEYDAGAAERQKLWDKIETNSDADVADKADREALEKLQDAFFEDTKHINSHDHCRHAPVSFMRQLVAKYNPEPKED